nr:MAG TPA: hypothetical protein [Caudoviricetes sp.]
MLLQTCFCLQLKGVVHPTLIIEIFCDIPHG